MRELRNAVQRAALLSVGETVSVESFGLPAPATSPQPAEAPPADPDREAIEAALARNDGVLAQAAADLGISRQALYRRMDKHGLRRGADSEG